VGKLLDALDDQLMAWIRRQHVFFVATAPTEGGRVNLSPKGLDTLRVLDEHTVAYLDLTGSGVETIAHLRENGRITLMWCAFEGPPQIVRASGRGEVVTIGDRGFDEARSGFPDLPGARAVITVHLTQVQTSCGYSVPKLAFVEDRHRLEQWADNRGEDGLVAYRAEKNAASIDGLPALDP
jgi:hypothetical protein